MKGNGFVPVLLGVGLALVIVVGVVAWGAGHYTNRTQTVTVAGTGAEPTAAASVSSEVAAGGAALYVRDGCINCHGPNGLGGVPNPQAPDKAIPPLSGSGFRHDFGTDQKITEMVRTGSVLGRAPIVSMPHWGGIISNAEL